MYNICVSLKAYGIDLIFADDQSEPATSTSVPQSEHNDDSLLKADNESTTGKC